MGIVGGSQMVKKQVFDGARKHNKNFWVEIIIN